VAAIEQQGKQSWTQHAAHIASQIKFDIAVQSAAELQGSRSPADELSLVVGCRSLSDCAHSTTIGASLSGQDCWPSKAATAAAADDLSAYTTVPQPLLFLALAHRLYKLKLVM
jgi:hypothetical protein